MKSLSCPNCGAPVHGDECEYCGSVFPKADKTIRKRKNSPGERCVRKYDPETQTWVWKAEAENPLLAVKTSKPIVQVRRF